MKGRWRIRRNPAQTLTTTTQKTQNLEFLVDFGRCEETRKDFCGAIQDRGFVIPNQVKIRVSRCLEDIQPRTPCSKMAFYIKNPIPLLELVEMGANRL